MQTAYTYDALNRLTGVAASRAGATLASYAYEIGAAGNRLSATELSGRKVVYAYDDTYKLTGETVSADPQGNNGAVGYGYDAAGNRLTRTSTLPPVAPQAFTYNKNDRITSDTYDDNGNTLVANGNHYSFDWEDHLSSVNNGATTYLYDGDGNRVAKTAAGVTARYLVDTNNLTGHAQVVEELENGNVTRTYTYGHDLLSENQLTGGNWWISYYGYDGHGSTRYLTDVAGSVTDTYTYDAFGNLISQAGSTPNDFLYSGEQWDANVGFYYLRARYYGAQDGRFLTADTFTGNVYEPLSLHKYLFAICNPVTRIDPSGHDSLEEEEIVVADSGILDSMGGLAQAAVRRLLVNRLTTGIAGALTYLFSNPETLQELQEDGQGGIAKVQEAFSEFEGTVSEAEAESSSIWNNYQSLRQPFNELYNGVKNRNPPNIEYHRLVEQSTNAENFSAEAINSWANMIPTPTTVHRAISSFYSSSADWLPEGFSTVRQ